jgi:hypothetical protein
VRPWLLAGLSIAALAGAREVRGVAADQRARWPRLVDEPYAPSPTAAPYVTLGYRELAADLLWIRARVYFGGEDDTAAGLRGLLDALVELDPRFYRAYEFAARAIGWVDGGTTQDDYRWALRVLERGMAEFPRAWQLPHLAGEIYLLELDTDDPAERAAWNERGAMLLERAVRMPGAPVHAATLAAHVRTELGQHERAARDLRELILLTDDAAARRRMIEQLAELEHRDADRIEQETRWILERFHQAWQAALPEADPTMYILVGDPPPPYLDLGALAVDRDLIGADDEPAFEPVDY